MKPCTQTEITVKDILQATAEEILTRTFQNSFGKFNRDDACIISIKEVSGNALARYRQIIDSASRLGTAKSAMFEDMDNMISQIPPLVKDLENDRSK